MVTWAYCLLLLALRPTAAFAQLTGEQAVLAALARADTIERVVNVDDPAGLYEAWQGAADEDIVLQVQGVYLPLSCSTYAGSVVLQSFAV